MRFRSVRAGRWLLPSVLLALAGLWLAACGSTPTPTPTPEPLFVHVRADGSDEYGGLEAAIKAVPPGSTLLLDGDTYRLSASLTITKALTLRGVGMDETVILSEAENYGLRFAGEGPFGAENITFRHEGTASADVVVVQGGEIRFRHCRFTGAYRAGDESARAGLRLLHQTRGEVHDCEAVENSSFGILRGVARHNTCSRNKAAGIHVAGRAQPTLEDNESVANGSGIAFLEQAGGIARRNECSGNGFVGISIGNEAQPTLEENVCNSNQYGLVFAGSKGGTAHGNECARNLVGILVGEEAAPVLKDNNCYDNDEEDLRDLRP